MKGNFNYPSLLFKSPPMRGLRPTAPGHTTQMSVGQMPVGGATDRGPEYEHVVSTMSGPPQRQHKTEHKGHIHSPGIDIKMKFRPPSIKNFSYFSCYSPA